jgi:glutaconate CoA-transferase subunit A
VIRESPHLTKVPGMLVTAIVQQPRAALPSGSHAVYPPDLEQLERYAKMVASPDGTAEYLERFVYSRPGEVPAT